MPVVDQLEVVEARNLKLPFSEVSSQAGKKVPGVEEEYERLDASHVEGAKQVVGADLEVRHNFELQMVRPARFHLLHEWEGDDSFSD
jgi:hypothetical protein